jgi:hypothetical protein
VTSADKRVARHRKRRTKLNNKRQLEQALREYRAMFANWPVHNPSWGAVRIAVPGEKLERYQK